MSEAVTIITALSLIVSAPCLIKAGYHAWREAHHQPKKERRP